MCNDKAPDSKMRVNFAASIVVGSKKCGASSRTYTTEIFLRKLVEALLAEDESRQRAGWESIDSHTWRTVSSRTSL